jgi:hypothetical protein
MVVNGLVADPNDPIFGRIDKALKKLASDGLALSFSGQEEKISHMKWSWVDPASGAALHMWGDYRTEVKYLELVAPDSASMEKLRTELTAAIKPPTRASLLAKARKRLDSTSLMRVVFSAPNEPDEETTKLVNEGLASDSQYTREAAAYGAGVLGWPDFKGPLEQALGSETEERVADSLRAAVALMKSGA